MSPYPVRAANMGVLLLLRLLLTTISYCSVRSARSPSTSSSDDEDLDVVFLPVQPCVLHNHHHHHDSLQSPPSCWINLTHPRFNDSIAQINHRGVYLIRTNEGNNFFVGVASKSSVSRPNSDVVDVDLLNSRDHMPMATTSQQAKDQLNRQQQHRGNDHFPNVCINGGPFDSDGWSSGPLVVNRTFTRTKRSSTSDTDLVGIGIIDVEGLMTKSTVISAPMSRKRASRRRVEWSLGTYPQIKKVIDQTNTNTKKEKNAIEYRMTIRNFVSGFEWLVYRGRRVAARYKTTTTRSMEEPSALRAPRTAIGIDSKNNLMLLVVDGCERCLHKRGPTLVEIADLLIEQGAQYGINMDGGGSSTMVMYHHHHIFQDIDDDVNHVDTYHNYDVINHPTCLDVLGVKCERRIVSVVCM